MKQEGIRKFGFTTNHKAKHRSALPQELHHSRLFKNMGKPTGLSPSKLGALLCWQESAHVPFFGT